MRIRISFTADITVNGGTIPRDDLVTALQDWLEESDAAFTDAFSEYLPPDIDCDEVEMQLNMIKVG